jgi:hypothetical protein
VDALLSAVLGWGKFLGAVDSPVLTEWVHRTRERAAYRRAIAD